MEIKDKEINEILKKAEDYRKNLSEGYKNDFSKETVNSFEKIELKKILDKCIEKNFENNVSNEEINDKNNVFLKCKISEEESLTGCTKDIKYKLKNKNGKKEINCISLKVPSNIKDGQNIILRNCGNYIKEQDRNSHLVIEIKIK